MFMQLSRRTLLRTGATIAVSGGLASACGHPTQKRVGVPTTANPTTTLLLNPYDWSFGAKIKTAKTLFQQGIRDQFEATHPGLRVTVLPNINMGGAWISSILAGAGPDVCTDSRLTPYVAGDLLLSLDAHIRHGNLDLARYASTSLAGLHNANGELVGLPVYSPVYVPVVNLSVLDEKAVAYPDPAWDYNAFTQLAKATTFESQGKHHYGTDLMVWETGAYPWGSWMMRAFGGGWASADGKTCLLGEAGSLAAGRWIMEEMIRPKVATSWGKVDISRNGTMHFAGSYEALAHARDYGARFKWDYVSMPAWPAGQMSRYGLQWYAINAATKQPEAAFELLQFVAYDTWWSSFQMKLGLQMPALLSLLDQWEQVVPRVAPVMHDKNLHAFSETLLKDFARSQYRFAVENDQAQALVSDAWKAIWVQNASVTTEFKEAAQRVNEFEAQALSTEAQRKAASADLQRAIASGSPFAAPTIRGHGKAKAPTKVAQGFFRSDSGVYTVVGDGVDVGGPTSNCVFAGSSSTAEKAHFTCRVTVLSNIDCPQLSSFAKVGLMAAANLSDAAPAVTLEVTGAHGIYSQSRPAWSSGWFAEGPGAATAPGLLPPTGLTLDLKKPMTNYLAHPIWLRLTRDGISWAFASSTDGVNWKDGGKTVVEMGGVWVGLFSTSHNGDFKGKGTIKAIFDHVSFPVTDVYQVGTP